jgi:hypothetical protein
MSILDGNLIVEKYLPTIVEMIEDSALWADKETFKLLPVWAPHAARGRQLYDASWSREYTNTKRKTGQKNLKVEGNTTAQKALMEALDVKSKKPKNWTVCHWGYDDPKFAAADSVVHDPRYFSCIANMIWLPTPLKGFTDSLPIVKNMLRICAYHYYGHACQHPNASSEIVSIIEGVTPNCYPASWPCASRPDAIPKGVMTINENIKQKIIKRKTAIKSALNNESFANYPTDVEQTLSFWKVDLSEI